MILIGIGANLPSARHGGPRDGCEAALAMLADHGMRVVGRSRWYESAPVPVSDQPWFVNGVVVIETALAPRALLEALQAIEAQMGRVRTARNAPRVIDLDLLAYDDLDIEDATLTIPHPRLDQRAFVLLPLREVAPLWRHPRTGRSIEALIRALPGDQPIRPLFDHRP